MNLRLLTVREAAEFLQVSQRSIRRWLAAGELECVRVGRCVRLSEAALVAFVRRREHGNESPLKSL